MRRIVLLALLVVVGFPVLSYGQDCDQGHGIYRPFNLLRQIKLGTAYLVNPDLPGRAQTVNVYGYADAVDRMGIEWVRQQMRQDGLRLFLAGPDNTLVLVDSGCLAFANLQREAYVGAERAGVLDDEADTFVTWDPGEFVATRSSPER